MWIIGSIHKKSGAFSISPNPKIHTQLTSAVIEAKRLAGIHTEKRFVIMALGFTYESTVSSVDIKTILDGTIKKH